MAEIVAADGHTYSKSASANATVAPTSGATESAAVSSARALTKLTEVEIDFVTVLDMHWGVTGELLSPELAEDRYRVPLKTYRSCWAKPAIQAALVERGIDVRVKTVDPTAPATVVNWRHATLTPEQLIVANTMLDLIDTRNDRKKLNDLGVTTHKWNTWLRQPEFQQYLQGRAESLLGASQHDAVLALVDRVRSGDVKAIELYWEYTGKYIRSNSSAAASGGHSISAEQVTNLVQSIIEIIVEEVDDPETGRRISERLSRLISARTAANNLVGALDPERVIVPQVMPEREITPEIEALMNSGVGSDT